METIWEGDVFLCATPALKSSLAGENVFPHSGSLVLSNLCTKSPTMMDHRTDFSFTDPVHPPKVELEFAEWAEGIKAAGRDSYFGKPGGNGHKFGPWARTNTRSGREEFRWLVKQDGVDGGGADDSDIPSPPLWENNKGSGSPTDVRRQMIAGYRQEMMDLVREAPESAYELSLTDMVEQQTRARRAVAREAPVAAKSGSKRALSRSGSVDSAPRGFLLNMFLPFSLPGKRGKRSCSSSKVSSLGILAGGSWWNKKVESRSSSNEKGKRSGWRLAGCFSFFRSRSRIRGGRRCE